MMPAALMFMNVLRTADEVPRTAGVTFSTVAAYNITFVVSAS